MRAAPRAATWFLSLFFCGIAHAGLFDVPSDIQVRFTATPTTELIPGQPISATLSVTNLGPFDVDRLGIDSPIFHDEFWITEADCRALTLTVLDTDTTYFYIFTWEVAGAYFGEVKTLRVGQTLTCNMTVTITRHTPPVYDLTFGLPYFYPDINPSNDSGTVRLQRAATPVPAASCAAYALLIALIAHIGVLGRKGRRCSASADRRR